MVACAGITWTAVVGMVASVPGQPAPAPTATVAQDVTRAEPPEPFKRVCSGCHVSDRIVQGRRFRSQWQEVLEEMSVEGAVGTDEDFAAILEHLVREYGRVNVNTATAPELAKVMHLDSSQAEALVEYRKKNGKFADFDALVAVPGAPLEALTKRRDALIF